MFSLVKVAAEHVEAAPAPCPHDCRSVVALDQKVLRRAHSQRVTRNLRVPRPVALHADDRLLDDVVDAAPADGPV